MDLTAAAIGARFLSLTAAPVSFGSVLSRLADDPPENQTKRIRAVASDKPACVLFHVLAAWQAGQIVALVGNEADCHDYLEGEDFQIARDPEGGPTGDGPPPRRLHFPTPGNAPAAVVLSSGTTGRPKGILLSRDALFHSKSLLLDVFRLAEGEVYGNLSRLHSIGGLRSICLALDHGNDVRIFDGAPAPGPAYAQTVLGSGISVALCGASFVRLLASAAPWLADRPTQLRALMSCGSFYDDVASATVRSRYGIEVVNAYGQTETSGIVMCEPLGSYRPGRMAPCLPGVTQAFRSAGAGLWELGIHTPFPFSGYLGRDDAGTDPIWTGDLVRREADGIAYAGRVGHAMKTVDGSGWLLPEVVEAWVRGILPGVEVVARPDARHEHLVVMVGADKVPGTLLRDMIRDLGGAYSSARFVPALIERSGAGKVVRMDPIKGRPP